MSPLDESEVIKRPIKRKKQMVIESDDNQSDQDDTLNDDETFEEPGPSNSVGKRHRRQLRPRKKQEV